jgi:hypothetical protein
MFVSYPNFRPCGHRFPLSSDSGSGNPDKPSSDFSRFGLSNSLAKALEIHEICSNHQLKQVEINNVPG